MANPTVHEVQRLLQNTTNDSILIDVGINVGFITNFGVSFNRTVHSIDPIFYNISKLCEGLRANVEAGWARSHQLQLYHAAAGPQDEPHVTITRPSNKVGKFDQASLSREAVFHKNVEYEHIPMTALDSIIPDETSIGVVKIDVQGHEYSVLQGMSAILSRKEKYPSKFIIKKVQVTLHGPTARWALANRCSNHTDRLAVSKRMYCVTSIENSSSKCYMIC